MIKFYVGAASPPKLLPHYCGRLKCDPNRRVDRVVLDRYVLHYVISGNGTFYKSGKVYRLSAGEVFISCPGEHATHIADKENPMDYIWISFSGPQDLELIFQKDVISMPESKRLFLQMADAEDNPAMTLLINGLLYQLLAMLSVRLDSPAQQKDYLREAMAYIEENYSQHLSVDEIAKTVDMSRSHFSRLFKRTTGFSPHDYIVAYRLEKGAQLLADPDLTQKEIATRLGYPDVSTFSRMFKRKYGISPGKYRQDHSKLPLSTE